MLREGSRYRRVTAQEVCLSGSSNLFSRCQANAVFAMEVSLHQLLDKAFEVSTVRCSAELPAVQPA